MLSSQTFIISVAESCTFFMLFYHHTYYRFPAVLQVTRSKVCCLGAFSAMHIYCPNKTSSITSPCSCQEALCSMHCVRMPTYKSISRNTENVFLQILSLQTPETVRMVSVSSHMRFSVETCFRAPTFNFFHLGGRPRSSLPLQVLSLVLQAAICCVGSGQVCLSAAAAVPG